MNLRAASLLFGRSAKNKVKLVSVHPSWLAPYPIIGKCTVLPVCLDIVCGWPTPARVSNCTVTALEAQNVAICECCQKALAVRTKSITVLSWTCALIYLLVLFQRQDALSKIVARRGKLFMLCRHFQRPWTLLPNELPEWKQGTVTKFCFKIRTRPNWLRVS